MPILIPKQLSKFLKLKNITKKLPLKIQKSKVTQNQKWPKIKSDPKSKVTQNQKGPKIKSDQKSKVTQNQK